MSIRVGSVGYATRQGLGYLSKDFYDNGIITDMMVFRHPGGKSPSNMDWYPEGTLELINRPFSGARVDRFIKDIDVVLFFETPFDWTFSDRCQTAGVKTVLMPMYEWFPESVKHRFDLFLNPSLLDQEYFPQGIFIPVPVDGSSWSLRTTAKRYLHNAGNIGSRGHKGTLELLKAMEFVKSPIELTVRSQYGSGLRSLIEQTGTSKDPRIVFVDHEIAKEDLFRNHDVYVAPEKYNGLSLPLQEAFADGMMLMTTDRFPTNKWLPQEPLIPVESTHRVRIIPGYKEIEESIVNPRAIAEKIDFWYGKNIQHFSMMGSYYGMTNSWDILKPRYLEILEGLVK